MFTWFLIIDGLLQTLTPEDTLPESQLTDFHRRCVQNTQQKQLTCPVLCPPARKWQRTALFLSSCGFRSQSRSCSLLLSLALKSLLGNKHSPFHNKREKKNTIFGSAQLITRILKKHEWAWVTEISVKTPGGYPGWLCPNRVDAADMSVWLCL